ncbi:MAG: WhiB family transcriptional regulator [Egibacteraceae bacterium]
MDTTTWRNAAACRDLDTALAFPAGVTGAALGQAERAKAICVDCLIPGRCLEWSLATGQHDGVWGGLTEDERRQLRRRRQRAQQARKAPR